MAPTIRTAEYELLTTLRDMLEQSVGSVNEVALTKAKRDGYVDESEGVVWLTNEGLDRLDELED